MEEKRAISLMHALEHCDREGEMDRAVYWHPHLFFFFFLIAGDDPPGGEESTSQAREAWSDSSTERLGLIGHGVIFGNTCPKASK